MPNNNH